MNFGDQLKDTQELDEALGELRELSRSNDKKTVDRIEMLYRMVKDYYMRKQPFYNTYSD